MRRWWMQGLWSMVLLVACEAEPPTSEQAPGSSPAPAEEKASAEKEAPAKHAAAQAEPAEPAAPPSSGLARKVAEQVEAAKAEPEGPTIEEALAAKEELVEARTTAPPSAELAPPTEEEFRAWDRKDPEAEKHLYEWDRDHLDDLKGHFQHLECARHEVIAAGDDFLAGRTSESDWMDFKRTMITGLDAWLTERLAEEPRILEKSKFIGHLLEAHELVMHGYPRAYNDGVERELQKKDAHWTVVQAKIEKYVETLGGELEAISAADCAKRPEE